MQRLRTVLKRHLPTAVLRLVGERRGQERFYFGPRWPTDPGKGYDDGSSDEVWRKRWPMLAATISGTGPLSVRPDLAVGHDLAGHNMLMTFLFVVARAAHGRKGLSILDWGGALGHYGLAARRLLPEVDFDYVVKELPGLCAVGSALNSSVRFVNDDDACFARTYDIVMANGSLHMLRDWRAMVARMARATTSILLINAVPLVEEAASFVILQRLRSRGFQNDFYSWAINRQELLGEGARHGLLLEREVISWGPVSYWGAPEDPRGGGAIFRRSPSGQG